MSRRTLTPTNEDVSLLLVPPLCDDVSCLMMLAMTLLTLAVSQLRIVVSLFAVCSATGYCWLRDPKSAVCFRCVRGPFNLAFGASAFLSCCYLWISSSSFVYKYQVSLSSISSTLIQVAVINRVVSWSTAIEGLDSSFANKASIATRWSSCWIFRSGACGIGMGALKCSCKSVMLKLSSSC